MLLLVLATASTLATQPPVSVARCERSPNTIAFDECLSRARDAAMRILDRYRAAARARIVRENPENGALPVTFDAAQAAWVDYKKRECDAVYTLWQAGTIRGAMALRCDIRMTQLRTHELWLDWLTDPNGPAPALPEPVVERGS